MTIANRASGSSRTRTRRPVRCLLRCTLLFAVFVLPVSARQGQGIVPTPEQIRLERFLSDASARTDEYFSLFQDLTADETKTIEQFRPDGSVSKTRRIVSDFVVYQAQADNTSIAEYRNVREVDGSRLADRQARVEKLLGGRSKSATTRDELARVTREGTRYDLGASVSGLTISEGLPLQAWARALFGFLVVGTERVDGGRLAVVLDYHQLAPNARFGFKFSLPASFGGADPLYRGRLWVDAETGCLWREVREIAVAVPGAPEPVVIQRTEFSYAQDRFAIPLPRRIVYTSRLSFTRDAANRPASVPVFRVTLEYGPFKRFTTSSDEGQIAGVAPPGTPDVPQDPSSGSQSDDIPPASVPSDGPAAVEAAPAHPADSSAPSRPADAPVPQPDPSLGPEFGPDAPTSGPTLPEGETRLPSPAVASKRTRSAEPSARRPTDVHASEARTSAAGLDKVETARSPEPGPGAASKRETVPNVAPPPAPAPKEKPAEASVPKPVRSRPSAPAPAPIAQPATPTAEADAPRPAPSPANPARTLAPTSEEPAPSAPAGEANRPPSRRRVAPPRLPRAFAVSSYPGIAPLADLPPLLATLRSVRIAPPPPPPEAGAPTSPPAQSPPVQAPPAPATRWRPPPS